MSFWPFVSKSIFIVIKMYFAFYAVAKRKAADQACFGVSTFFINCLLILPMSLLYVETGQAEEIHSKC